MNKLRTDDLMTIGTFARETRLSRKALRLYDAMGLLAPIFIDERNGYRYYADKQIEQAKIISLLRQLEMPLHQIADVLEVAPADRMTVIMRYWQEVESDIRNKRKLVHFLEHYLEGKESIMFKVETRHVAEQKVITVTKRLYAEELPSYIGASMTQLFGYIQSSEQQPAGAPFVVYHGEVNNDSDGPIEICVPFSGSLEPHDNMQIRLEPAHQEAYTRLNKAQVVFPDILQAYQSTSDHIKKEGKTVSASPREIYFADWNSITEDDPACDIAFPYKD